MTTDDIEFVLTFYLFGEAWSSSTNLSLHESFSRFELDSRQRQETNNLMRQTRVECKDFISCHGFHIAIRM